MVRYWDGGRQRERSFRRNWQAAVAFSKTIEAEKPSIHRGDVQPVTFREYSEVWLANHHVSLGSYWMLRKIARA